MANLCRIALQVTISAVEMSSGPLAPARANTTHDRLELDRQWQSQHFPCPYVAVSPSANCCFFPLVAPIRMIDGRRCRGDS